MLQFYYLKASMNNVLLEQAERQYLANLLSQHPSAIQPVGQVLHSLNQGCQQRIQDGSEVIMKRSRSLPLIQPRHSSEQLHQFVSKKMELEKRLQDISPRMPKAMTLTDQERIEFIRKMQRQQEELKLIKEENARISQFKIRQRQQQQRYERERTLKERQEAKRLKIQRRLQELEEERELRQQEIRERNKEYQQVAQEKTLLHKIQENYSRLQEINLREKKKKLAQIRQIHKPMSRQQFQQHLSHINEYRTMHETMRRSQREARSLSPATQQFYKSHWHKQVINEQKVDEECIKDEKKELLKQLKDRQKKYSEYIKHNFAPDPDEELIEERLKRKHPPIKRKKAKEIRSMGLLNLKVSKQMKMSEEQLQEKRKSHANPPPSVSKPRDYLQQIKANRRGHSVTDSFMGAMGAQKPLDGKKAESVKALAERMEQRAEDQWRLQKVKKSLLSSEADDLYMGVLNAKLQLLGSK